jgi:hypothetical protein
MPYRDTKGFRKQVVLLTAPGKLLALHNGDGRVLWSTYLPQLAAAEAQQVVSASTALAGMVAVALQLPASATTSQGCGIDSGSCCTPYESALAAGAAAQYKIAANQKQWYAQQVSAHMCGSDTAGGATPEPPLLMPCGSLSCCAAAASMAYAP